jgi:hypothetical protein
MLWRNLVRYHVSEWLIVPIQELVLNHSGGMRVIWRWVHEAGSTSSKYGASNLPCELYYCNFLSFDSTQRTSMDCFALERVCSPMQSAEFWGFVWSKIKICGVGIIQSVKTPSPYFPLHLLHTSTSTQFSKWQYSLATYKPCYLSAFFSFIKAVQMYGIIV